MVANQLIETALLRLKRCDLIQDFVHHVETNAFFCIVTFVALKTTPGEQREDILTKRHRLFPVRPRMVRIEISVRQLAGQIEDDTPGVRHANVPDIDLVIELRLGSRRKPDPTNFGNRPIVLDGDVGRILFVRLGVHPQIKLVKPLLRTCPRLPQSTEDQVIAITFERRPKSLPRRVVAES